MNEWINNVPGINKKPIPITPDSLLVGSSNPKLSIFTGCLPPPVILREAEGEVAESKSLNEALPFRRRGTVENSGWGKALVKTPSSALPGHLLPGVKVFLQFLNVDSATPGKPCVQNDLWVRWQNDMRVMWQNDIKVRRQNGRRNSFIQVCIDKHHDMNRSN